MIRYLGIDPGLSGAVACLECDDSGTIIKANVHDIPTVTVLKGKTNRREYLANQMAAMLDRYRWWTPQRPIRVLGDDEPAIGGDCIPECPRRVIHMAVIESVHAMPGNGSIGNFAMGYGLGLWVGILATHAIPYTCVPAPTWKKALAVNKEKAGCILRAQQLFPDVADQLTRKKDDGRAEALLLAEYARRLSPPPERLEKTG